MGNTVLTFLRKIKHPNIVHVVNATTSDRWYSHWASGAGASFLARRRKNGNISISLHFKLGQERYEITLTPSHFTMIRHRPKSYDYVGYQRLPQEKVAELIELPYNDFESMIFQQSLVGDLGMFGADEAFALYKLRNVYFGECN